MEEEVISRVKNGWKAYVETLWSESENPEKAAEEFGKDIAGLLEEPSLENFRDLEASVDICKFEPWEKANFIAKFPGTLFGVSLSVSETDDRGFKSASMTAYFKCDVVLRTVRDVVSFMSIMPKSSSSQQFYYFNGGDVFGVSGTVIAEGYDTSIQNVFEDFMTDGCRRACLAEQEKHPDGLFRALKMYAEDDYWKSKLGI